jgi:hypothetical protein
MLSEAKSKRLLWTEATGAAFLTIKTALAAALLLAHPLPSTTLALAKDASSTQQGQF